MISNLFELNNVNLSSKYKLVGLKKKYKEIKSFNLSNKVKKSIVNFSFIIKKKRPDYDLLKKEENEVFNFFNFKYPLGFFSGCTHFSFRVTFKEYKVGLKPAKFSLLLNQFCLNLERFIDLVQEILVNNFPLTFYEDFFGEYLNDLDFKIHFLVILRTQGTKNTTTKFFIVPKGCFISHLRENLWLTLFSDPLFLYTLSTYYKGFRYHLGVIFLLIIYYVYKLLHQKLTRLINKHKVYDYEQRAFESIGNVLALNFNSSKLYFKSNLRLPRYSYFFSSRCLDFFVGESFDEKINLDKILKLKNQNLVLDVYFDLVFVDEDIKEND